MLIVCRAILKDVAGVARLTAENVVSIGASLAHVHVPGRDIVEPSEGDLKHSEIEIGMGKRTDTFKRGSKIA